MNRPALIALAAGGSAALLLGAFGFQYLGGILPCAMCLWQRWPHGVAIALGGLGVVLPYAIVAWAGAASAATTAAIGLYHTGVERAWWPGPSSCTGSGDALSGLSGGDLLNLDGPTGVVMCDEVAWQMFGLSMASWNAAFSAAMVVIWVMAARRPVR